jgi:hypothetical protein
LITLEEIQVSFDEFLRSCVQAGRVDSYSALLTPIEYPNGDSVVVYVGADQGGQIIVSDLGSAEAELVANAFNLSKSSADFAQQVSADLDVRWDAGRFFEIVESKDELADICWRVAQASARMAGAARTTRTKGRERDDFPDLLEEALTSVGLSLERNQSLEGASGHQHKPMFYEPERELVIENISGRNAWPRAAAVLAEFTDLSRVNGYRFLAVVDDREDSKKQERNLLGNVAEVSQWTRRDEWINRFQNR